MSVNPADNPYLAQFRIGQSYQDGELAVWAPDDASAFTAAQQLVERLNAHLEPKYPLVLNGVTPCDQRASVEQAMSRLREAADWGQVQVTYAQDGWGISLYVKGHRYDVEAGTLGETVSQLCSKVGVSTESGARDA